MARVLVVDDHPALAQAVAEMARMSGCEAAVANDGEAALHYLRANRVDLVILDVSMPGVSGLDVLRSMAADGLLLITKVLMFSASKEHRQRSLLLGATGFILKHEVDDLVAEIVKHTRCGAPPDDAQGRSTGFAI